MPASRSMPGEIARIVGKLLRLEERVIDEEGEEGAAAQTSFFKAIVRSREGARIAILMREPFPDAMRPGVVVEVVVRAARDAPAAPAVASAD